MARYNTISTTSTSNGAQTITSPSTGLLTTLTGTAPYTTTIPNPILYTGQQQSFYNATGGVVTLTTPSGNFTGAGASGSANQTVAAGAIITIISDGANYVVQSFPGGSQTASSLTLNGALTANPTNANISLQPTGTGSITINPGTTGSISNMTGSFTTLSANGATTLTATTIATAYNTGALQVSGGVGIAGAVFTNSTASIGGQLTVTTGGLNISGSNSLSGVTSITNATAVTLGTAASGALQVTGGVGIGGSIYTAGAGDFGGNVIGNSNLIISGNATVGSSTASATPGLTIAYPSGVGNSQIAFTNNGSGASGFQIGQSAGSQAFFIYDTSASANRIIIDTNGNLLLGMTSFNNTGVSGTSGPAVASNAFVVGNATGDNTYFRRLSSGISQIQTTTSGSNSGSLHLQPYGGNVGIGTTSPSAALTVVGSITENGYNVVSQADIGTLPNQIPLNQYLGSMAYQAATSYVQTAAPVGHRNVLINGDFRTWQRGTSFTSVYGYTADRWQVTRYASGADNASQITSSSVLPTGFDYGIRVQRTTGDTGGTSYFLNQPVESINSVPLAGQYVTLSFWARCGNGFSSVQAYSSPTAFYYQSITAGVVYHTDATNRDNGMYYQNFKVAASTYLSNIFVLSNTWQYFTFTCYLPTNIQQVGVAFGTGTSQGTATAYDYFDITGVQLEAGVQATPFERITYQDQLARCQRYYQEFPNTNGSHFTGQARLINTVNNTNGSLITGFTYGTTAMRVSPSVTFYGGSSTTGTVNFYSSSSGTQTTLTVSASNLIVAFSSSNALGVNSNISITGQGAGGSTWMDCGWSGNGFGVTLNSELT